MSMSGRIDAFQRRHRWAAVPLAVAYKLADDDGPYLAAMIAYYGFVSLFPLLLLGVTLLGFVLHDDPVAQQAVLTSALRNFPVIGDQIRANVRSLEGSWTALVVGVVIALYGGLGVTHAAQHALNQVWAVPKAARPSIQSSYGRGLLMVGLVGMGLLLTAALSAATSTTELADLGVLVRTAGMIVSIVVNIALFLLTYRLLTPRRLPVGRAWVGAVSAGLSWQVVLTAGTYLLATRLPGASATYGLFAIVLGLLFWIYVAAALFVVCAEIDAVLVERLYPRSLFSFYPDNRDMTRADRRAYASYAETERQKDHQRVDVSFDPTDRPEGP